MENHKFVVIPATEGDLCHDHVVNVAYIVSLRQHIYNHTWCVRMSNGAEYSMGIQAGAALRKQLLDK